ncbi:hypothetical protein HYH03_014272 [Edaphochlamys debaryana]|uniref:Uncharacterized protein n=1 Tax=Edaphochlamys debaryana TaxID=47281 RepID=A0A835XRQ3_9CHLO|nr:hypothetical protein HYH03_014272 [Edaphochlamys debaryana]|eukprot:KAG2487026.1 hypothetical protein HYH03_014272 [Edaphochlamys debaryana]
MAPAIRAALLSVSGEDATSIQPIVGALSDLGFNVDVDDQAGGAFRLLEADKVHGLNGRQQLALKAAIQGTAAVAAGLGAGPAGASEGGVLADIKARLPCSSKYAAHLLVPTKPSLPPHKEAATVVGPHHVATYAHEGHSGWTEKHKVQVFVHCPHEDRRVPVDAEVVYHNTTTDIAILEVQRELPAPVLDSAASAGDKYYIHGQSTQAQADATSISHGMVAATELDAYGHIRGDIVAGAGDSGGGCFSVATGKLIAMVVGSDHKTNKVILVPIATISSILAGLSAQKAPGAAA